MKVYVNDFVLLKKGYVAIMSDIGDVIESVDIMALLGLFFEVKSYWSVKSAFSYKCYVSEKEHLFIEGHFIASGVAAAIVSATMPYNDYILLLVDVEFRSDMILVVLRRDDSELIGVISSQYGNQSSLELSKFIISLPEIDWSV